MVKKILVLFLIVCISFPLWSEELNMKNAEPYEEAEFPKWALDIRRGEILFFGSLPLTFMGVSLVTSIANSDMEFWPKVGISCAFSAAIALADYIIGEVQK